MKEETKAGQSNIAVGARVRIEGVTGEESGLNGITGQATHPFAAYRNRKGGEGAGWIGIWVDDEHIQRLRVIHQRSDSLNIEVKHVVVIEE